MTKLVLGPLKRQLMLLAEAGGPERVALLLGVAEAGEARVYAAFRVDNVRGSPVEFEGDPWQLVVAHKAGEKYGLEVVGVYHTHPSCPPTPSVKDLDGMKRWPYIWAIACPGELRAWRLAGEGRVEEVEVE